MVKAFPILLSTALLLVLLLSVLSSTSNVSAFSINQNPVIAIGQWRSSSYGTLNPQGGLAFDSSGTLWVGDTNNRVLGFTAPFNSNMSATYVLGQGDFQGIASGVGPNRMGRPFGVTVDSKGNLWVADPDNNRILAFEPPFFSGMEASIVIGQSDFSNASANTTRNRLSWPSWSTFDASGDLWVADTGNSRVLEFQPPFSTDMNTSVVIGEPDFNHKYCESSMFSIDPECSNHSTMKYPSHIAFDPSGDLWVAEEMGPPGTRLLEYKPPFTNSMSASLVISPVQPSGLAFDSDGNLWLGCIWCGPTGSGRVLEYKPPFSEHNIALESGVAKNQNFTLGDYGEGGVDRPNVMIPMGLNFDSAGNLWVVDYREFWDMGLLGRVLAFDAQRHSVSTSTGPVYFENRDGLLFPLSWIPATKSDGFTFPEGLFNFTIQGLPAGGSATVTVSFPHALPSGIRWWSNSSGRWGELPAAQTQVSGNNITLTLINPSENGVISELGGPALTPTNVTSSTESITTSSPQLQTLPPSIALGAAVAFVVIATAVVFYWKRLRKSKLKVLRTS